MFGDARLATTDEMWMIRPDRCSIMGGVAAFVVKNNPRALIDMTRSYSSAVSVWNGPGRGPTPALLTRMSSRPRRSRMAATTSALDCSLRTSCAAANARPPAAVMALAVDSASSASMSATTTSAPSAASVSAMARPMPRAAPVTNAT